MIDPDLQRDETGRIDLGVYCYTRAQALRDGCLFDVSALAQEAGFRVPVAVSSEIMALVNDIDPESGESVTGRLWDILTVLRVAANHAPDDRADFTVSIAGDDVDLYAVVGPGDTAEPVMTIMLPWED